MSKTKDTKDIPFPSGINQETDIFINYIEKRKRNLKKKLNEITDLKQKDNLKQEQMDKINQEQNIEEEIFMFQKMKEHYLISHQKAHNQSTEIICQNNPDNLISISLKNQKREILDSITDIIYYSRLAYQSRIVSEPLSNFYRDNILIERKVFEEISYGQEKQSIEEQLKSVFESESIIKQEIKKVDKSILNERIQPQILELDEDFEDEGNDDSSNIVRDDQEEEEKEQVGSMDEHHKVPILCQMHSQNYDGDSEKSHTENEVYIKSSGKQNNDNQGSSEAVAQQKQNYQQNSYQQNSNRNQQRNYNNYSNYGGYKYFRRYKQNRYREERFTYERKARQINSDNKDTQKDFDQKGLNQNNEYESDRPFQSDQLNNERYSKQHNKIDNQAKQNFSDTNQGNNQNSSQNANSSNNNLNYHSNTSNNQNNDSQNSNPEKTNYKKPFNTNQRRQNPYRKNNAYDTDREKEQKGSSKYEKN